MSVYKYGNVCNIPVSAQMLATHIHGDTYHSHIYTLPLVYIMVRVTLYASHTVCAIVRIQTYTQTIITYTHTIIYPCNSMHISYNSMRISLYKL